MFLIDREMTKTDIRRAVGLSSSSLAKFGKGENVTTDVLLRICETLGMKLHDIVDSVEDKRSGIDKQR